MPGLSGKVAAVTQSVRIEPIGIVAPDAVEHLLDRAFGTDRHGRTAYRIREGMAALPMFSFVALDGNDVLLGSIQCWPIALHADDGACFPLVMVGPVAVDPALQRGGIGRQLMAAALAATDLAGIDATMLIGDPEYYGRFFGFGGAHTTTWRVPGPVEQRRLLARGSKVPDQPGMLGPRVPANA
ncbi:MAG: N-acetyltransferase [Sphingomonas sp.]|jgi:predicted N-acetyltransferase YhbS